MSEHIAFTISLKRRAWTFLPLLSALYSLVISNEVEGPFPAVVYAPINGIAIFNCTFSGDTSDSDYAWFWTVGDTNVDQLDHPDTVSGGEISILRANVPQQLEPIGVMCELYRRVEKSYLLFANSTVSAEIKPYGQPSPPGNLSVSISEDVLSVTWTQSSSPPGVSVNYTVTFLSSSGTLERSFFTKETSFIVSLANQTEMNDFLVVCQRYMVRVFAENLAGIGLAAEENITFLNNNLTYNSHCLQPSTSASTFTSSPGSYTINTISITQQQELLPVSLASSPATEALIPQTSSQEESSTFVTVVTLICTSFLLAAVISVVFFVIVLIYVHIRSKRLNN